MTLFELITRWITSDAPTAHSIIHSDANTVVETEGGPVRSLAKLIADSAAYIAEIAGFKYEAADYTAFRAYSGVLKSVLVLKQGAAGQFVRDDADTTSADNGGTVIVDAAGRRWKRVFSGPVLLGWFGGSEGGDCTSAFVAAFAVSNNVEVNYRACSMSGQVKKVANNIRFSSQCGSVVTINASFAFIFGNDAKDGLGFNTQTTPNLTGFEMHGISFKAYQEDAVSAAVSLYGIDEPVVYRCGFDGFKVEGLLVGTGCINAKVALSDFRESASTSESKGLTFLHYPSDYVDSPLNTSSFALAARPATNIKRGIVSACTFTRTRIQVSNVDGLIVSGCYFNLPATRGINLSPFAYNVLIAGCEFNLSPTSSTGINISQSCQGVDVEGNRFYGGAGTAARCVNAYYGVSNVNIRGNTFAAATQRDITISVNAEGVTVFGNTFAPTIQTGDNILITSQDFYNGDTTIGATATDATATRKISVKGNVFSKPRARCVYVKAQKSTSNSNPLNIIGLSADGNEVYDPSSAFISNGDCFIRMDADTGGVSQVAYGSNPQSRSGAGTITRAEIFELPSNGGAISYASVKDKSARFSVAATVAGTWVVTRISGDESLTLAVAASGADFILSARYLASIRGAVSVVLGGSNFADTVAVNSWTASPDPVFRFAKAGTPLNYTTATGSFVVDVSIIGKP